MTALSDEIAVIIRQINEHKVQRLIEQLAKLHVPDGYYVSVQIITEAYSIAAAYNEGMKQSTAQYKIYIGETAVALKETIIDDVINWFLNNEQVGMIGWYGSEIPIDGYIRKEKSLYWTYCKKIKWSS